MDVEQFKDDVRAGRIDVDRLVELVLMQQRQLQAAQQRIEELEKKLGGSSTKKVDEPFSLRAEEQRQQARGKTPPKKRNKPQRRGRVTTAEKIAQAARTEKVFPAGVPGARRELLHQPAGPTRPFRSGDVCAGPDTSGTKRVSSRSTPLARPADTRAYPHRIGELHVLCCAHK